MRLLAWFHSVSAKIFHRAQIADEVEAERESHIAHRADDLERSGLSRAEAEQRARIEFGGQVKFREECHEALGGNFIESCIQDLRLSVRSLRKSPGFVIAAIATLALAIGANAVVFSVMNAFILRPLNVPDAQSLYELQHGNEASSYESYPDYLDLRDRNRSFSGVAAYNIAEAGLDTGKDPYGAWVEEASGNYFDTLDLKPYLGRFFHAADEHGPNSAPYIVLTYAFWRTHFQGDRGVVGRVVHVNKHPFTILGVAPPDFHGTILFFYPDFFVPLVDQKQVEGTDCLTERGNRCIFTVMGSLKPGVTPAQATADVDSIGSYLEKTYPKAEGKRTFTLARPGLYGDYLGRPVREFLTALMLLSGLILLAACANLGSLFAARAADHSREIALRLALGSSRKRILRSVFTEAALISLAGGAVGLGGSVFLLRGLSVWEPIRRWPIHVSVLPDARVYLVALFLAVASALFFGAIPVRQVLRTNPYEVVKAGASGIFTGKFGRRMTMRDVLLVVQIAICAVLVTSSFVALRGLARSLHADFGFDLRNTMVAQTDLSMAGYSGDQVPTMQKRIIEAVEKAPGIESAAVGDQIPLGDSEPDSNVFRDGTSDLRPSNAAADSYVYKISPGFLHAEGTSLLSGRVFTWQDDKSSPRVAVVNGEFARKVFGSVDKALGASFKMPDGTRIQVVGIAEDGKYQSLTETPQPAMFLPILQWPSTSTYLVVRSKGDPREVGPAIRSAIRRVDAALPVFIETRYAGMESALFAPRMATISLGILGLLGAMLALTGIFGMAAYTVSKRLRELGIRIALGAQRKQMLRAALGRPLKLLMLGSGVGLLLGLLATKVLAFIVYQASPRDPLVLAGVVLAMALLGLAATWIPAQRALSVDPLVLLREE